MKNNILQVRLYILLVFTCICDVCGAQLSNPAQFSHQLNKLSDNSAEIVFTGNISSGWHVYSPMVSGGPTPASFHAEKLTGATLDGGLRAEGHLIKKYEEMFETDVSYFEGSVKFIQKLKLTGGKYEVEGYLEYGACSDQMCTPPKKVDFTYSGDAPVTSKPVAASAATAPATSPASVAELPASKEVDKSSVSPVEETGADKSDSGDSDSLSESAALPVLDDSISALTDSLQTDSSMAAVVGGSDLWTPVISEIRALDSEGDSNAANMSWWKIFFLGFIGGLVALVTPCVWPIIPMTVSFFLKRSSNKRQGIRDAWIYGLSIVVIYVLLGLIVTALFGASALNSLATNAVFNIFFFLLLVVFAASFFGAFELTLPSSWSSAVDNKAEKKGGLIGIFLMAFTLTLVSFSCTGPIIGFLLVEVASDGGSIIAPTIGMLGFAIALALPFTLFALFPNWLKSMPKSGGWMNTVKVVLGFIELAFALKFLSVADLAYGWGILDREVFLSLWIVIFALLGFYLLGKIKFKHDDDDSHIGVVRFSLALISLAFAMYMVPGLWGAPLKAVSAFAPPMKTQDFNLSPEQEVKPMFTDYEQGMRYAQLHGKPVLIDFTGYGCVNCRKMEASVWTDSRVANRMTEDYVLIQLYVDDKTSLPEPVVVNDNGDELKLRTVGDKWSFLQSHKFGANAQPFYVILDGNGHLLSKPYTFDEDVNHYLDFLEGGLNRH